jgi:hypothetical protein
MVPVRFAGFKFVILSPSPEMKLAVRTPVARTRVETVDATKIKELTAKLKEDKERFGKPDNSPIHALGLDPGAADAARSAGRGATLAELALTHSHVG